MTMGILFTKPKGGTTYGVGLMGQGRYKKWECRIWGDSMMERGQAEGYAVIDAGTGKVIDRKNVTDADIAELEKDSVK